MNIKLALVKFSWALSIVCFSTLTISGELKLYSESILDQAVGGSFKLIEHESCVEIRVANTYQKENGQDTQLFFSTFGGGISNLHTSLFDSEMRWYVGMNPIGLVTGNREDESIQMAFSRDNNEALKTFSLKSKIDNLYWGHSKYEHAYGTMRSIGRFLFSLDDNEIQPNLTPISFGLLYLNDKDMVRWNLECRKVESVNLSEIARTQECVWLEKSARHAVKTNSGKIIQKPYCW